MDRRRTAIERLIWLLPVLAAVRVLAFSAAYPVFNYIDEALHVDTVLDFARVGLPGAGDDRFNPDAARLIATHGSGQLAPPYVAAHDLLPPPERDAAIAAEAERLTNHRNAETFTPPLYYGLAAGWDRLGRAAGIPDHWRVYWLRFFSAPLYGAATWIACRICLDFHARGPALAAGAGILLVAWPQDILYSVNSDVLSPLAVASALYLLLRWMHAQGPSVALAALAGGAASLAMLTKYTNVAALMVLPVAVGLVWMRGRRRVRAGEVAVLLLAAAVPLGAWMVRCQVALGDWTASRDKVAMLDWTVLPLAQSLQHPIFTPHGTVDFLSRLCVTFWRGELVWDNVVQRIPWVDGFYLIVSAVGLMGLLGWLLRPSPAGRAERPLALIYLTAVAGSVCFLGLISARYDYGHCFFPSRGFPYFAAGRLLTGVMVPFAILLAGSFAELVPRKGKFSPGVVLATLVATVCLASEIYLCTRAGPAVGDASTLSVFQAPTNAYHLLREG